jgi:hypothetical protein
MQLLMNMNQHNPCLTSLVLGWIVIENELISTTIHSNTWVEMDTGTSNKS